MKLYTEDQIKSAIQIGLREKYIHDIEINQFVNNVIKYFKTIELPSDEKIEKEAIYFSDSYSIYDSAKDDTWYGFSAGAKWVIERIKKQIK